MDILSAIIAGLIQGATEFLPVSSSGHLALFHDIFGLVPPDRYPAFDVLLHFGTLIAVISVYRRDVSGLIKGVLGCIKKLFSGNFRFSGYEKDERAALFILTATLPLVAIALSGAGDLAEAMCGYPLLIGAALIFNGIVLMISDRYGGAITEDKAKFKNAFIIGLFQAAAIVPGVSRSGATVTGGLVQGYDREYAVKFSFLLSIPAIIGANVLKIPEAISSGADAGLIPVYLAGFAAAALSGLLSVKLLRSVANKSKLKYFSYYCFAVGGLAVIWSFIEKN